MSDTFGTPPSFFSKKTVQKQQSLAGFIINIVKSLDGLALYYRIKPSNANKLLFDQISSKAENGSGFVPTPISIVKPGLPVS